MFVKFNFSAPGGWGGVKAIWFESVSMFVFRHLEIRDEKFSCCLKTNENANEILGYIYSL